MDKQEKIVLIGAAALVIVGVAIEGVASYRTHRVEAKKRKQMADLTERTKAAYKIANTPAKIKLVTRLFNEELDSILTGKK